MSFPEIFQYFGELQDFFATVGHTPNNINNLESTSRHLEDHISILATFLALMGSHVQQNVAERTLCIILEGIYESYEFTAFALPRWNSEFISSSVERCWVRLPVFWPIHAFARVLIRWSLLKIAATKFRADSLIVQNVYKQIVDE